MTFEEITLRPPHGTIDLPALAAWLDASPFAFRDPVEGDGWHLSASAEDAKQNRAARIANPRRFPPGVRVLADPNRVIVAQQLAIGTDAHVLGLVSWLVRDGGWTVAIDQAAAEPIGDPRRLFPDAAMGPDPTTGEVNDGERATWHAGTRRFAAHPNERRNPELFQLFAAYFHEDWRVDSATPDEVIDTIIATHAAAERVHLADLLDAFTAEIPDDQDLEPALFEDLGCYFVPAADARSVRSWLQHVSGRLRSAR